MQGGDYNAVNHNTQVGMTLFVAQYDTLNSYLVMRITDDELRFDQFPEWAEVLTNLQQEIQDFFTANADTAPGVDMPGFDPYNLHMWYMYIGKLTETLSTVLGAMCPRTHSFANGRNLIDPLADTARALGVNILMDTRGTELIADEEGRAVGARC